MNKIKFSHRYEKLKKINLCEPVTLLEVFESNTTHLSDCFLTYDTSYYDFDTSKFLKYPLLSGRTE